MQLHPSEISDSAWRHEYVRSRIRRQQRPETDNDALLWAFEIERAVQLGLESYALELATSTLAHPNPRLRAWAYGAAQAFKDFRLALFLLRSLVRDHRIESFIRQSIPSEPPIPIEAPVDLLPVTWSTEEAQNLNALYGIDAEDELVARLSEQIAEEIDREILQGLADAAAREAYLNELEGRWGELLDGICDENQRRMLAQLFENHTRALRGDQQIRSARGRQHLDAGFIYAPYVPLQVTQGVFNPSDPSLRWHTAGMLILIADQGPKKIEFFTENEVPSWLLDRGIFSFDPETELVDIGPNPPIPPMPACLLCLDSGVCPDCDHGETHTWDNERHLMVVEICQTCERSGRCGCRESSDDSEDD